MSSILLVDDEPRMLDLLTLALEAAGHETRSARDADVAWRIVTEEPVDLVVLDVMLPGTSGLQLCTRIRENSTIPVILLTALGGAHDRVAGLEAGADDYLAKPFSPRELVLRVDAVLRRSTQVPVRPVLTTRRRVGDLVLDASLGVAWRREQDLHLTPAEFRLLWLLTDNVGATVPLDRLLEALHHGGDQWRGRPALRTAMYRLRGKVADDRFGPRIVTEHGRGYRFVALPGDL